MEYILKINLRRLWTLNYSQCPDWVDSYNVIYKIENLINGKIYIGQARWFYGRLVQGGNFSHYGGFQDYCYNGYTNSHLYNAIRRYRSKNFEVSIIDILETSDELNNREVERIAEFNSFHNGYNMTSGGENCEQLHTPEAREKAFKVIAERYNGDICGQLHTLDALRKRSITIASQYNGDPLGPLHTPEARFKATIRADRTNRFNHNGRLAWNTHEAYEANKLNHDGNLAFNTPESRIKANKSNSITRFFKSITQKIEYIKKWHPELKDTMLTWDLYWYHCDTPTRDLKHHVNRILELISDMRLDPRWTSEMENIFGYVEDHKEELTWLN